MTRVIISFVSAAFVWRFPNRSVVFPFYALVFAPTVFFNAVFHAGATAASGVYCPGLLTALTLYPPLFVYVSGRAYAEGLIIDRTGFLALVVAVAFHGAEVGHNVLKAW